MEQTLYEYIIEKYGFYEDEQRIVVIIQNNHDLFKIEATPMNILKSFSFYDLNMIYVISEKEEIITCEKF